jgi:hypothetical protein
LGTEGSIGRHNGPRTVGAGAGVREVNGLLHQPQASGKISIHAQFEFNQPEIKHGESKGNERASGDLRPAEAEHAEAA